MASLLPLCFCLSAEFFIFLFLISILSLVSLNIVVIAALNSLYVNFNLWGPWSRSPLSEYLSMVHIFPFLNHGVHLGCILDIMNDILL